MPEDQPKVIDPKLVEELKARGWTDAGIKMYWTSQFRSLDPRVIEKLKAHGMTDEEIKVNYTHGPRMYTNVALVNMQEALQEVIIEDQGSIIHKLKHSELAKLGHKHHSFSHILSIFRICRCGAALAIKKTRR